MTPPTILLFDVDGTLVLTGGAGRRAIERAFATLGGRPSHTRFPFEGMTDRAIARAGLRAAGLPRDEASIDALLEAYVSVLADEVAVSKGYRVMPGVFRAVEAAAARPRVALGLGTGNVRRGAEAKLGRAGLWNAFGFGGFGCDSEDRAELLRIGAARGAATLGERPEACRTVVVGDTPRDVAAALAIGADCVAVGTGGFAAEDLRALGATAAFDDLDAAGAVEAILG